MNKILLGIKEFKRYHNTDKVKSCTVFGLYTDGNNVIISMVTGGRIYDVTFIRRNLKLYYSSVTKGY